MSKGKILIVDDDTVLSFVMSEMLSEHGYDVETVDSAESAYDILTRESFRLLILDINLPDALGFEICKEIRKCSNVPIIFASARTSEDDRVDSLDIGGDDYLQKPYSMKELLAHVNALMRRTYGAEQEEATFTFGDVVVNFSNRTVQKNGKEVALSLREFDLLSYFCKNKGEVLPKNKILAEVWGTFSEVETQTVVVHVRWLREKLEDDPAKPKYIKTVYKVGYSFC